MMHGAYNIKLIICLFLRAPPVIDLSAPTGVRMEHFVFEWLFCLPYVYQLQPVLSLIFSFTHNVLTIYRFGAFTVIISTIKLVHIAMFISVSTTDISWRSKWDFLKYTVRGFNKYVDEL